MLDIEWYFEDLLSMRGKGISDKPGKWLGVFEKSDQESTRGEIEKALKLKSGKAEYLRLRRSACDV